MSLSYPLVSIILPVYNGEQYLAQAIGSCLQQTYKNIELIIVNDCSTDATLTIARSFADNDSRVKVITNEINKRLPASLNIGHNIAKGEFLTWTSDDNLYLPTAIEIMVNELLQSKVDFVYANFDQINEQGTITRRFKFEKPEELIWRNVVGACFLYTPKLYRKNKGYREDLFMVEDYDFWLRAFMQHKFKHISKTLYKYRKHSNSLTNEINNKNSEKQLLFETNKYKMFEAVFKTYMYPTILQDLILQFQKEHTVNANLIIDNISDLKQFYRSTFPLSSYKSHLYYLKDKYIKGIRGTSKQGIMPAINLIYYFGTVMTFNDYKTALKIAMYNVLDK